MQFIDRTEIKVRSGAGGPGLVCFARAKYRPKMGPSGGDGGFGGHVIIRGNKQLNTLAVIKYRHVYSAGNGQKGGPNGRTGANGDHKIIHVPLGSIIVDKESCQQIGEITQDGQELLVARGGKRGLGNMRYLSSTHQAPEESTPGGASVEKLLVLELKLMADVGLCGFPNAGKSTLISTISNAKPAIADYPFTTLTPHLGVVELGTDAKTYGESFVVADVPGLVEGASQGKGLGLKFLKHLERTRLLLFCLDGSEMSEQDPIHALTALKREIGDFNSQMRRYPNLVVITKTDAMASDLDQKNSLRKKLQNLGYDCLFVSSATGEGLRKLKRTIADRLAEETHGF